MLPRTAAGTDGLWDNIPTHELYEFISTFPADWDPQMAAQCLLQRADYNVYQRPYFCSPFCIAEDAVR
jgi:hypothetical protein